jgi:thiamine biosynthesis lipoprotein ApbE
LNSTVAVSAVAKTATASDALSTTLFLLGPEKGKRLIDSTSDTAAIWISPGGEVEMSATGRQIFSEPKGVQLGSGQADSPEHSIQ